MATRGIPTVEEIEKAAAEDLRRWCREKFGCDCDHCHSSTAENWCVSHPLYGSNSGTMIH